MRPGASPLQTLAKVMSQKTLTAITQVETAETITVDMTGIENIAATERRQAEGLLHLGAEGFVQWLRSQPEPMVVLVIDQFEELFTLAGEYERQQFLALILGAIEHASDRFKLIITLRSDFMTPCLAVPELAERLQTMSVLVPPTLSQEDYQKIILRPAEQVGLAVEPELVTVLLQDLSQGMGDLPLLEFVLGQIWEKRQPGQLSLQVYQDKVGGLSGALERKAQAVYEALGLKGQACAQWIFLNLTQLGEGTADTRRQVTLADLVVAKYPQPLVEETLQALTTAKLVVMNAEHRSLMPQKMARGEGKVTKKNRVDGDLPEDLQSAEDNAQSLELDGTPVTIEVAHEILIRHWSTLRWWLEENRTRLRSQRQVEQAALAWQQNRCKPDFLLRGIPLDAAVELYVNNNDELPEEVQRFVEAGIAAREDEQQQIKKRLKQAQSAIALISILALGAVGLGSAAYLQRQQARLQEIEALNALSSSQMANDQYLDATVTAIEAGTQLKTIRTLGLLDWQASLAREQTIGTLQQAIALSAERNRLEGHSQSVEAVAYSPDGQTLASVSLDDTLKIWQPDGTLIQSVATAPTASGYGDTLAVSADGQWIAIAHLAGQVTLWHPTDTVPRRTLQAHAKGVTAVAFSPDGTTLATAGQDEVIKLWNVADGQLIRTLSGHTGWVNSVSWHPDSKQLASGGEDKKLKVWDVDLGEVLWEKTEHRERVASVDWSGSGEWIAVGEGDRAVKLWRVSDRAAFPLGEHETGNGDNSVVQVNSVRFSPDSQRLLSTGEDGALRVWQVEEGRQLNILRGHRGSVQGASWYPNGDVIASAGKDSGIRLWQLSNSAEAAATTEIDLYSVQFGPDGKQMAGISWDGSVELWENVSGVLSRKVKTLPDQKAYVAQLDFVGDRLATANDDGVVRLWDVTRGVLAQSLIGHEGRVTAVGFGPERSRLLSGGEDRSLRLWDVETGEAIRDWMGHEDEVSAIAWHPTGKLMASGAQDGSVNVWDKRGDLKYALPAHNARVSALTFSPDGRQLVTASLDQTIKIWRVRDGSLQHTLSGYQQAVTDVEFVADGSGLLSVGGNLKLWDIRTGALLKTVEGTTIAAAESIDMSDDRQWIVSSSVNGGMRLQAWKLDRLIQDGCEQISAYLSTNPTVRDKRICEEN